MANKRLPKVQSQLILHHTGKGWPEIGEGSRSLRVLEWAEEHHFV